MRNFKFTLWLFALFMIGWSTQAQNVQIGSGTTTTSTTHPISGNWGYSYTQQIYTQAQVSTAGEITKIRFYYVSGTTTSSLDWVIYMGHTTKTSFSSKTDWVPVADMTEVFNGEVTYPAAGNWMEITLATPFVYNNTDNLVIAVDENTPGYSTITWRAFDSATNTGIYYRNDSTNPDPSAPPTAGDRSSSLAQVQLYFLESCPGPSNIVFSNIGTDHADVNWTSNGTETQWKIKYGISGFNVETEGTLEDVSSKPHTISSLTANTAYHVYVKADCGGDQSAWVGPVNFTTACDAFSVPFAESFDAWGTGSAAFPDCWTRPVTYVGYSVNYPSCVSANSVSTPNSLRFNSDVGIPTYAVTPAFTEDIHNLMITFSLKASSATSAGNFEIGVMSNPNDISTFELVQTITPSSTDWTFYEVFLNSTTLSGANNCIAFRQIGNSYTSSYFFLEDVSVDLIPACPKPNELFVNNITATSATLNWTENGSAVNWNIKASLTPINPAIDPPLFDLSTSNNPYPTPAVLTPNTTYYWYVQADCGGGDVSEWSAKGTFTTECGVNTTYPFIEEFEGAVPPSCWSELRNPTTSTYGWSSNSSGVSGKCARFDSYFNSSGNKSSLSSQTFDITGLTAPILEFDYKNPTGGDFTVLLSTDGGATYPNTLQTGLTDQTNWTSFTYDLSSYISTGSNVKIALVGTSNYSNGDAYIYVDNFTIREMSDENDILTFSFAEQTGPAVVNNVAKTVAIEVAMGTVLTALTPAIAISDYASISPESGVTQDFTNPVTYTVTAENSTAQAWEVTVTESTTQSSEKDILTFVLPGQTGPATIGANTIDIEVGWLSNLSSLTPTITISDFATISPLSNVAQNFSTPVTYTVTAEDGTTKDYLVTVTQETAPLGANCANPFIVNVPGDLIYTHSGTTCGLGNVYNSTGSYDDGEDAIYRLDVASNTVVKITMNPGTVTSTGLFLFDGCPDTGSQIKLIGTYTASEKVITQALTAGVYYVMIDKSYSPNCFAYDLTIETVCLAPTAVQAVNLTATSADLQWTAGGFETAWNVKVNATSIIDPLTVDGDIVANANVSTAAYSIASGLTPEAVYYVYVQANCGSAWTQYMFTTPSACPVPTGLVSTVTGSSTASIAWNELGVSDWLIKVSTTSLTDPEAETADFANNTAVSGTGTFNLTGLSANTTYYWYVKSACGSAWSTEGEFTTECSAFSVPFAENFDTWGTGSAAFPDCWTRPITYEVYDWYTSDDISYPSIVSANSVSSPNSLRFQSLTTEPTYAITPAFTEDIHNLMVSFQLKREGTSSGTIEVGVMSNRNDVSTFELVKTITPTDNNWTSYEVFFNSSALSGANNYIAFKHVSLSSSYFYWLDDVAVYLIPSCPKPITLFADNVTASSASLNWTEIGSSTTWNLKVSTSATFDPTTDTADFFDGAATGNPHSITGLDGNTTYYWYVQADCGGGDVSAWSAKGTFTTECGVNTPPFSEDFSTYLPECWTRFGGILADPTVVGTSTSWIADGFANVGTTGAARLNIYGTSQKEWLVSPSIDLGDGSTPYVLSFDLALTAYGSTSPAETSGTDDKFAVVISTDNGATWSSTNALRLWDNAGSSYVFNNIATTGESVIIDLSGHTGVVKIGFYGESTIQNADNDLSIDDFTVDILPQINQIDINNNVANVSVCQGEAEATAIAALAPQITITDTKDAEYVVDLTWTIASYDATTPAVYAATGTFELPSGVQQTNPATVLEVTTTVTVNAPIEPTFVFTTEYCLGDVANALPTTSENMYTGTWSPAVIATDVAGDADYVFTADAGQCATNPSVTVTINAPIEPTFSFDTEYCLGDVVSALPTTSDNSYTGVWSPSIVATDVAVGAVDYVFTVDAGQCATNATVPVTVHALPELTCQSDFSVTNVNPVTLTSTPAGGTHTGTGITPEGRFSANGLANDDYTITYTYTHPTTGCTNFCEFVVTTMVPLGAIAGIDINNVVEDVVVCEGTDEAAVLAMLVDSITIADGQANEYVVGVNWTIDSYDGNTAGNYDATGVFELPMEVSQTDPVTALEVTAIITVNAPVLPTFSFDTEYCLNGLTVPLPIVSDNGYTGTWNVSIIATDVAGDVDYVFTVDPNQCATNASIPVTVHALPVVECPVSFTVTDFNPVNLTATPVGGIYSGAGITEDVFSANGMVNGEYFIAYDYTDPITGCSNFCEFAINIVFPAISDIDVNNDVVDVNVCQGDDEATAIAALVSEITIMDANDVEHVVDVVWTIDAYDANTPADYNATGTFELPAGVLQTDPATTLEVAAIVTVNAPIEPTFVFTTEYCLGDVANALPTTSENMYTGTWSPAVIATDVAGDADYVFTADAGQCATNPIITVTVNDPVVPTFDFATEYCLNDVADELPSTSENGITGTWSPAVIATDVAGDADYVFTADAGQCATNPIITVTVNDPVVPTFDFATEYCLNDVADELPSTSENGITGTWVPATIATDVAGDVDYVFTADAGQCATGTSVTVTVNDPVEPTFVFNTEYCLNDVADELPLVSENGYTGVWDVSQIATDVVGDVNYVFIADAGQCATSPSVTVTVNALPEVTCPDDFTVAGIDVVTLTGTPAGGTFEGPGVTDNMFTAIDLVDGDYIITYTYTDATTGCSNTCEFTVTVDFTSSIGVNEIAKIGVYPNPNNGMFTISFANVDGKANYQIYDAKGSIIVDKNIHTSGDTTEDVSLSLVPGVYFIKVVTANQTIVEKLVIQ